MKRPIKSITAAVIMFILNICAVSGYYSMNLPDSFYVESGGGLDLSTVFEIDAVKRESAVSAFSGTPYPSQRADLRLFGMIPVKSVELCTIERPKLIPGGEPFGIKLLMQGVMIVDTGAVSTEKGMEDPAGECGLEKGDMILYANGFPISENAQLQKIISDSDGAAVDIIYVRDEKKKAALLKPVMSRKDGCFKAGIWVRDSTAGIGTMTFYEPETCRFGGLGHPVCDSDTGEMIPISSGETADVNINQVIKGTSGCPGELHGSFCSGLSSGLIRKNSSCGVFGEQFTLPDTEPLPMALKQEVETGPAVIRTTVGKDGVKEYTIEIEDIDPSDSDGKNMVIRVTDQELIDKTGGIVQGMSGSPIIQNGMLVGAVTHVLVNDPEKGFGIFCENMYSESRISGGH